MEPETAPAGGGNGPRLITHKIRLEVVDGPSRGFVGEFAGPEVRIGTSKDSDLVLTDRTVSRHHLLVRVEGQRIRITDAGSLNGTFLDGIQILDAYARPDSILAIGDSKLRLQMLPEAIEVPLSSRTRLGGLIGQSVAMRRVFSIIERAAKTDMTVLVEGETGTGKELVAEALHEESRRAQGPLHVLDCSTIPETLIDDELFGHVRNAFTGALSDRPGAFEEADGGTLFLDEIGELPLSFQPKLLRALADDTPKIRRLGSNVARQVDVRVVAATNRCLAREVELGRFRQDLYQRLKEISIMLPPLRERREDIPLLVRHFEHALPKSASMRGPLSEDEIQELMERTWEGNVRELRHEVKRKHALGLTGRGPARDDAPTESGSGTTGMVQEGDPQDNLHFEEGFFAARERVLEKFERCFLAEALRRSGGNVSQAAHMIGVSRKFMHRAIVQYKLREH